MKQKKRVVAPTRKVVAADTGTYRLGRNGRGGAEAGPPTPPPTTPPLKLGISVREEEEREVDIQQSTYCGSGFYSSKWEFWCLRGFMGKDWKTDAMITRT